MQTELGVLLAMFGGIMVGNCMLSLNYLRRWRWENAWIVFSLVALILIPWTLAFLRVPNLPAVYAGVRIGSFTMPVLYGAGWGVAQVLFGLAVVRIGMALSFAITIGLSAALGTFVPILTPPGGSGDCSWSSSLAGGDPHGCRGYRLLLGGPAKREGAKDRHGRSAGAIVPERRFDGRRSRPACAHAELRLGLWRRLYAEAVRHNAAHADAPYAVWPIVLAGGAVPNLAYALWLVRHNKSWGNFFPLWPEILSGTIMGALWMGSVAAYGTATTLLGVLGASIGWSIYQICIILTANISGWIAGEWKGVSRRSRVALWGGLFLLGSATLAITYGSH